MTVALIDQNEVIETQQMITEENLDVRTITLGISLIDCISSDLEVLKHNIYHKIDFACKEFGCNWKSDRGE